MTRGRPRSFDCDKALDQALMVFWEKGYEGASIADLTEAMGINPPSLYAAFGNKESLFRKALDRYVASRVAYWREALAAPTAREAIETLLRGSAEQLSKECNRGCLMIKGTMTCGEQAEALHREMAAHCADGEAALRQRFEQGLEDGDLPPGTDPAGLARYIMTVVQGMSLQSERGATGEQLQQIVDVAMLAFPPPAAKGKAARRALKVAR